MSTKWLSLFPEQRSKVVELLNLLRRQSLQNLVSDGAPSEVRSAWYGDAQAFEAAIEALETVS
jgi:hypothetical protein